MSIERALADAAARLVPTLGLDAESARIEARSLLAHALGRDRSWLAVHGRDPLPDAEQARFAGLVARRLTGEPVAYLTGRREFFGLDFKITPAVLIPRPETETLVEAALERIPADGPCRILDLGTGSGAVAIAIKAHRPRAEVTATDDSAAALALARENARRLLGEALAPGNPPISPLFQRGAGGDSSTPLSQTAAGGDLSTPLSEMGAAGGSYTPLSQRGAGGISFLLSDWFSALGDMTFHVIVSNPPYVAEADPHLAQGDLRFEPRAALAAGADGLDCIRRIVRDAPPHLGDGGWLLFEHGYDQAEACRNLLRAAGLQDIESFRDLSGIERVTVARRLTHASGKTKI